MDYRYYDYQRQVRNLENSMRPALSTNNYQSRQMRYELRGLQNDLAMRKDPRAVEARMKGIQWQAAMMERQGGANTTNHSALSQNMASMRVGMQSMQRYHRK